MKAKVISLPNIFLVLYVLCFTRPRYQVSVYRNIGPLVILPRNTLNATCMVNMTFMVNVVTI